MEDLESKCYDKFDFKLENLQILIAKAGNSGFSYTSKVYMCFDCFELCGSSETFAFVFPGWKTWLSRISC